MYTSAGVRCVEPAHPDLENPDDETETLHVRSKGNRDRTVYLGPEAMAAVLDWLELRGRAQSLFLPVEKTGARWPWAVGRARGAVSPAAMQEQDQRSPDLTARLWHHTTGALPRVAMPAALRPATVESLEASRRWSPARAGVVSAPPGAAERTATLARSRYADRLATQH